MLDSTNIFGLRDKLCVVVGASSGLGMASAKMLDALGARVVGIARRQERLEQLQNECRNFRYRIYDFSKQEGIKGLIDSIVSEYGKISGMAYFAGFGRVNPLRSENLDAIKSLFDVHVFSAFECVRILCDRRRSEHISIVLASSIASILSVEGLSGYGCAKGSINALCMSSLKELARYGGRINAILPGEIDTEFTQPFKEIQSSAYKQELASYPLGRGEVGDVANLCAFLLSPLSRLITGQMIIIDGGRSRI